MGKRVIAIESLKDGVLNTYGEGEYIGDKEPNGGWMKGSGIKNPCIKLDNGNYVWGYQCWWGDKDKFYKKYGENIKTTNIVEIEENIKPKKE